MVLPVRSSHLTLDHLLSVVAIGWTVSYSPRSAKQEFCGDSAISPTFRAGDNGAAATSAGARPGSRRVRCLALAAGPPRRDPRRFQFRPSNTVHSFCERYRSEQSCTAAIPQQQWRTPMDLGIKGRKAIVCAASKGLGKGCAMKLAEEGVDLTICARTPGPARRDSAGNPRQDRRQRFRPSPSTSRPTRAVPPCSRPVPNRTS